MSYSEESFPTLEATAAPVDSLTINSRLDASIYPDQEGRHAGEPNPVPDYQSAHAAVGAFGTVYGHELHDNAHNPDDQIVAVAAKLQGYVNREFFVMTHRLATPALLTVIHPSARAGRIEADGNLIDALTEKTPDRLTDVEMKLAVDAIDVQVSNVDPNNSEAYAQLTLLDSAREYVLQMCAHDPRHEASPDRPAFDPDHYAA